MRVPYLPIQTADPIPSLGGSSLRHRPVLAVRISGPGGTYILDGLLDTGADETVFEGWVAALIGVDLSQAEVRDVRLMGRPQPIRCSYARVELLISDGAQETYVWEAVIGFVAIRLRYPLLGQAAFLQFFDSAFRGADGECHVIPNRSFPGRVLGRTTTP